MSVGRGTPGTLRSIGAKLISVLAVFSMLGLVGIGVTASTTTPAGAVAPARTGLTAETAAPSCYSIKQNYPAFADGLYWLQTPKLVAPEQFYCDQTTAGGGWVLVGRGREAWSFQYWGQGSPSQVRNPVTGPEAFQPATLSTPVIDGLMNGGRMDALTDGIRLRRATNPTGTTWQEARMRIKTYGKWSWAFGGGIYMSSVTFDSTTTNLGTSNYNSNTTANVQVQNDTRRINTTPQSGHNLRAGFSFGSNVTNGANNATSYLWEFANENSAIPFTQVFIRPTITEANVVSQGADIAPDTGLPGSTIPAMLDHRPTQQTWGVTGINNGTSIPSLNAHVTAFADIGNTIYVGGKFLQVQHGLGGPTFAQSYLAAFDKTTGEWIPSFNPVVNAPVWEIMASPDGTKLFVGGEFTSINGQANTTGLAALNPTNGAPVATWSGYVQRTTGLADIRTLDIQGGFLYVGGLFNRVGGGIGANASAPIVVGRLARLAVSDGRPDGTWKPNVETAPQELDASAQGDRVYVVGLFKTLNGVNLSPTRFAVIDSTTAELVPGLQAFQPNSGDGEWMNTVREVGNKVYLGGSQHFIHQYDRTNMAFERSHMTKSGGDYQAMAFKDGILYGACHCQDWQYEDANSWADPVGYTEVNPVSLIGAYDTTNDFDVIPEFHTTQLDLTGANGEGPWELYFDSNGCMWAGGDIFRTGNAASPFYGGFERFCDRDSQAPSVPNNAQAAVAGNDVTLSWNASTDNFTTPIRYEVLKDDPTFGTIVMGSTFERSLVDDTVVGPTRYFVRAVDAEGNRSATTQVISVNPPPVAAATLLSSGATWSYLANGEDLGTAWHAPGFDVSAWPTGPSEFGWGDGDEATVIPSGTITQYFVKQLEISNPAQYQTATVRLKRDDGAVVYVNGVEAVRDNLPAGPLSATTPASGFASGTGETTFFEYQIPSSLLFNGSNTIAVELHQPDAANLDASFDLELVARNGNEVNAPTTPAPAISDITSSTLNVAWPASTDDVQVIGYVVRRNGTIATFTTATSFPETGLTPSTEYAYDVRAVDSSGNISAPGVASTTTTANQVLIGTGSVWSFQSGGVPAPNWNQNAFDSSGWASGPSQLGWGDGDEATLVPSGPITQYYLHHFNVDDPDPFQLLNVRLKRDDGAAVYINGVEVVRSNLGAGPLTPTTFSASGVGGAAENTWNEFTVPGDLLVTGDNVIAAEVHQDTNNNVDSTFDLELVRKTPTETTPPTRPSLTLTNAEDTSISFSWNASTDAGGILGYLIRRNGAAVGVTTATNFTDSGLAPTTPYGYQVVAIDSSGNASTPGVLAASTTANPYIVPFGATWDYRFDGVNQGSTWMTPEFDISSWDSGDSELGIGDGDEATVIGPTTTPTPITAYFRRTFEVHDLTGVIGLTMDVVRDDGFVVYLNGVEVARSNMPAGPIAYSTRPLAGIAERIDETTPVTISLPTSALQIGDNVMAVEMHQANNSSNDLSFNLRLRATFGQIPVVTVEAPVADSYITTPTSTFSGLCSTGAGDVTVHIDGTDSMILTAPCVDNEWTVTGPLVDGGYNVLATQTVPGGLTGTSDSVSFVVDTSVPVVTVTEPAEGVLVASTTPTIAGTCSEAAGTVHVNLTGASAVSFDTPCTAGLWSTTAPTLATGAYAAVASQTNGAGTTGTSPARNFQVDATAPTTTDNTAAIGNAWRNTPATVTLTPVDAGGAGVGQTYYTTDGSTPTTASATGTTIELTADNVYTIRYFSVDTVGNTEAVKTAATQIRIDTGPPSTTDDTAAIGNAWTNQNQTVTLTPTDAGQVAATYYTTNGTTPTTGSSQGTSISLTTGGTYTIKYFSVDAAGNAESVKTAGTQIRIDKTAPTTTDNTAAIGNAWKTTAQDVTLTPADTGGAGVAATYYTTDGSTPTTASAQGTTVALTLNGTFTIRYFSVDAAGNAEAVKTAGTQIRIDLDVPTNAITFPADQGRYNSTTWSAGCSPSARICGTAADTGSGVSSVRVSVQRSSNNQWWTGSGWSNTQQSVLASGTTSWNTQLSTSQLSNGVTYTVTSWTLDAAGRQSVNSVRTFTYDTSAPTTTAAGLVTTNKNGVINANADTFSVTFNESLNPATVPAAATLTLTRNIGNTSYGISGLTDGTLTTGSGNYFTSSFTTRTVTFAGTLVLSNNNQTVTFTVTGPCVGSACGSMTSTTSNGQFQFEGASTLRDLAGNAPSTSSVTAASTVMF